MSSTQLKLKINQLSKSVVDILEKETDYEKKIKIFENFYNTLSLIQDMYNPFQTNNVRKRF